MKKIQVLAVLLALVVAGLAGSFLVTSGMEQRMRANLLQTAQLIESSLSREQIGQLRGYPIDAQGSAYRQVRSQLVEIGRKNPELTWIYLLGQKSGATGREICFLASAEPDGYSLDPPIPGRAYPDAPLVMHETFDEPKSQVYGPYQDQWGQWITAIIPLVDPASGRVMALLGVDVDGSQWRLDAVTRSVLPLVLFLLLLAGLGAWLVAERTVYDARKYSLFHRLLYPLAGALLILVSAFGYLFWLYQEDVRERATRSILENAGKSILLSLDEKTKTLVVLEQFLLRDAAVMRALRMGAVGDGAAEIRSAIESLKLLYPLDCVSLLDVTGRIVYPEAELERVLQPRHTLVAARQSGEPFVGIELALSGDIVYRRVAPVYEDGQIIGFVSVGRKVWDVVGQVASKYEIPILVTVKKDLLKQREEVGGESGMVFPFGEELVYHTEDRLSPDRLVQIRERIANTTDRHPDLAGEGQRGRLMHTPILDAGGQEIGTFRVLVNTAEMDKIRRRDGLLFATGAVSLGALLFALLYVLVRRAERSIEAHQKSLEEKTSQAVVLAQKANAASIAKTHFLNNVSHELRTPLNGIMGFGSLLEIMNLTTDQRNYLARMMTCSRDLLGVIDNLLQYTTIETGDFELCETTFALSRVLEPLERHFANLAAQKVLSFNWDLDAGLPEEIYGDEICLNEILRNVLVNAIKFTERGEVAFAGRVQEGADGSGRQMVFSVTDTGIGIMPDELDVIFEGFSQVDDSSTRQYGGLGIGLALSRKMARKMGGDILVKCELGRGSTFTVFVPLRG